MADGVLFMMLMNSTDPKFIIGEQVIGAPFIAESGIEAIGTGYIVCEPGGAVGEVGSADLMKATVNERVRAYALAASMFGFKMLYLEAGSGATSPVPPSYRYRPDCARAHHHGRWRHTNPIHRPNHGPGWSSSGS